MTISRDYASQNFNGGSDDDIIISWGVHSGFGERLNTFNGGGGDDRLDGRAGRDIINGEDGNDTLLGGTEDDLIRGGTGNDFIIGGAGADEIYGGQGFDTAAYRFSEAGVTVYISNADGTGTGGAATGDQLFGIERLIGSRNGDTLHGSGDADVLEGGSGTDTLNGYAENDLLIGNDGGDELNGGAGDDILRGGNGSDSLDGGDGIDTADYRYSYDEGVNVTLGGSVSGGSAQGDTLSNIENLFGTGFADTLGGDAADNLIRGFGHGDNISGSGGDDRLFGMSGDDTVNGGDGDDRVSGGKGTDTLTGGDGADRFVLALDIAAGTDTVTDFSVASGDILVVNTADGDETTLADLGVSVADSGNHANLIFGGAVVMTLNDIDHTLISDANFGDYFEVI